jgi:hypothetical protein
MAYDVATIEREFKIELPARAKTFVENELARYKGARLGKPFDTYGYDNVDFGNEILFDEVFFDPKFRPGKMPLASLKSDEGANRMECLMLDCTTGAIELGLGGPPFDKRDDPTLRPVAKDLDAFLATLKLA